LLRADDVTFGYGDAPVLHDVRLAVARGDLVGILGPNGSGKSTLLRLLAGTLAPDRGRVTLDGVDLQAIPRRRLAQRMAVVAQETDLAFDYSVVELALMGRYPHLGAFEIEGPRDLAIALEALATTGTAALAERTFSTLSGGEKQRVVLAAALAQFPSASEGAEAGALLLLDEPTASLDLAYQLEIAEILGRLGRERGLTIVVSTHDLNFAASLCRTLVLLRQGRILASGFTRDVLTPESIAALYGVRAEVWPHEGAGHLAVLPLSRIRPAPPGER
jgi:iron complex transport system ATP-binding protein